MPRTVLLIEDDPRFAAELGRALEHEAFAVEVAADGEEGLRMLGKRQPSVVVLDLILPKIDGFAVLEEIGKSPALTSIPVVVLSNLDTPEMIERAVGLGAISYLAKPNYDMPRIVEKIKAAARAR